MLAPICNQTSAKHENKTSANVKDSCVFVHKDKAQNTKLIIALLVDDILVAGEEEMRKEFATEFSK